VRCARGVRQGLEPVVSNSICLFLLLPGVLMVCLYLLLPAVLMVCLYLLLPAVLMVCLWCACICYCLVCCLWHRLVPTTVHLEARVDDMCAFRGTR